MQQALRAGELVAQEIAAEQNIAHTLVVVGSELQQGLEMTNGVLGAAGSAQQLRQLRAGAHVRASFQQSREVCLVLRERI